MTNEDIEHILFESLKKIAPDAMPEKLSPDANIRQTLDIDSFDFLQFIVALDKRLGIAIPEEDYGKISTIRALKEYLIKNEHKKHEGVRK